MLSQRLYPEFFLKSKRSCVSMCTFSSPLKVQATVLSHQADHQNFKLYFILTWIRGERLILIPLQANVRFAGSHRLFVSLVLRAFKYPSTWNCHSNIKQTFQMTMKPREQVAKRISTCFYLLYIVEIKTNQYVFTLSFGM